MKQEFVSYEQAVALKELGFDEECLKYYLQENGKWVVSDDYDGGHFVTAPLKQQVFRWFREKYDAHINPTLIMPNAYMARYGLWTSKVFSTYEEIENACIDKLIELAKLTK